MFRELKSVLNDSTFKIVVYLDKVYLNNYEDILVFENNYLLVKAFNHFITIKGDHLTISKFESSEVLVQGLVKSVELGD